MSILLLLKSSLKFLAAAIGDINLDDSDEESVRDFKYESDNEDVVVEVSR